jgi:hypothetical protein
MGDFMHYRGADVFGAFYLLDSSYLSVLWKPGLLGLLAFLLLWALFPKQIWFVYRHATDRFQVLCAAAMFVAFIGLVMIGIESGTSRPTGSTWSGSC